MNGSRIDNSNRRSFLKYGAAFPLAVSALKARGEDTKNAPPRRIIFICNSLGFYAPNFYPKKQGDLSSSEYLKHVETKEKMTVFQNFFHPGMATSNHDSEKSFLTGAFNPEASSFVNTVSLDQIFARKMGTETRFPFLNFSIYDRGWGCSWNERGSAIPPMHDETKIFKMLFGEEDLKSKKQQLSDDNEVLECLRLDLAQLLKTDAESSKLKQYESLVRELDAQLEHQKFWLTANKPKVANSLSADREFEFSTKIKNLFELAKLAFRTDSTRVITFSMDWIYGAIKVPGATGGWHTLSHHGGNPKTLASLSRIEANVLKHFNRFVADLDQITDGDGTLLDHTTVVMGSNFGDASNHTCNKLPIIVAGGGHQHCSHRTLEKPTPLCNLYLELLNKHDVDVGKFGSSEKNLKLL